MSEAKNNRPTDSSAPTPPAPISHSRLWSAASAALAASAEVALHLQIESPNPIDLKNQPIEPDSLRPYTTHEITEATRFLIRMGYAFAPLMNAKSNRRPAA